MSDNELGQWMKCLEEIADRNKTNSEIRIANFKRRAGEPHAIIILGDDPDYQEHIGFWRVCGGIIRIKAKRNGDFDPSDATEIEHDEIQAIASTQKSPIIL